MDASASSGMATAAAADAVFMDRALELAARGVALTSPNPMVGAVLVRDGRVVGEGFHTYDGVRHAEIIALEAAGESRARRNALHQPGALLPHGPHRAMHAGVDCRRRRARRDGDGGPEPACGWPRFQTIARRWNRSQHRPARGGSAPPERSFRALDRFPQTPGDSQIRAHARWPACPSSSRKEASSKGTRISQKDRWISSPESRAEVQQMRHASDALLTGIGTVLVDDPLLTDRTGLPRRRKLLRVVMDSRLRLPLRSKLVRSADGDVLVFTRAKEDSPKARALRRAGIDVVHLAGRGSKPDLPRVVAELGRREILSVLLEAGAILNSAALAAGIVDKMRVFFAPKVAGSAGRKPGAASAPARFQAMQEIAEHHDRTIRPGFRNRGISPRCLPDSLSTLARSNRLSCAT